MSGKVIIIDSAGAERTALKALLETAYFDVLTFDGGDAALGWLATGKADVILMGFDLKGSCGVATCRRFKAHPSVSDIPIVLITDDSRPDQRIGGFDAGADDILTRPVDQLALFARMRSLARYRMLAEELRLREATSAELGLLKQPGARPDGKRSKIAVISTVEHVASALRREVEDRTGFDTLWVRDGLEAMRVLRSDPPDGFVVTTELPPSEDRGALCSALSYHGDGPTPAVLVITRADDAGEAARCLDQGASDYIADPPDPTELAIRLRAQMKRKLRSDQLRKLVQDGLKLSLIDPLTGLYNRRYVDQHLCKHFQTARESGAPFSLLMFDIDRFKSVNDRFGHDIGDQALRVFAERLRSNMRGVDLIARIGGEEFLAALPGVGQAAGFAAAERVRKIAATPTPGAPRITVSAGVACLMADDTRPEDLIRRADMALYQAKSGGRNCVMRHKAA